MGKKEDKQFPLTNKKNCAVYLNRIISSCERCMDRLKKYNVEGNKLLVEYMGKDVVPHEVYVELLDKTSSVIMYLLNLLGDAQTSSISYFKFHKHISKHPIADVRLNPLEDETRELLNDFNRMRNWQNHIPESLLVAEMEQVEAGKMTLPMDPVSIIVYKNVSYAYFKDIIEGVAYEFDILTYRYNSGSDHFDMDHKDYYLPFLEVFKYGSSREGDRNFIYANPIRERDISEEIVNAEFGRLCKRWELFPFIHILKCTNAKIEFIDQFSEHFAWNSIISNADYDIDNFFVAQIRFECTDFDKLKKILNVMPQSVEKYFELSKNYIVLPNEGFEEEENSIYTIKFSVHPASIGSKIQFRKMMNQYLREIYKALENVQID